MTTWTRVTIQLETWAPDTPVIRVFSPLVFSHDFYNSKRVFALGSSAGVWDATVKQVESWTTE
jgi:hypothetical protein